LTHSFDVVIAGAGLIGAACAAEFVKEGLTVAIVEPGTVGGGATSAGMGHLVVMDDSEEQFALTAYGCRLWQQQPDAFKSRVEYQATGTLWIAADDEEADELERKSRRYQDRGVAARVLSRHELAQCEPHLRSGLVAGLLIPDDGVIYAPVAARLLVDQALAGGAKLYRARVTAAASGTVLLHDGTELRAPRIVNATGTDAHSITSEALIRGRKGYLAITDRFPGFLRHQVVEMGYLKSAHSVSSDSVAFNLQPRATGQILIGSSRQFDKTSAETEPALLSRMLGRAMEFMPALANLSIIRTWTGFRAAAPDKLPLIGPTSDSSVFLATGHEGLGITTSIATATLLVDRFAGRSSSICSECYLPARRKALAHG
jgi:D-hydroxyproline dehydrogenase subunit beta